MNPPELLAKATNFHPFQVGNWTVEPAAGQISRDGIAVKLEPKVMEVLSYLASRQGELVTRDDLERDVWKGAVIGYDSITTVVIKLRKALGDSARNARYRLSGDIQLANGNLRVHVHLLDLQSGRQIWSERYHRPFENLFQHQGEMSRQIASALSLKVSEAEQARMARPYTSSMRAYELFLKARSLLLVRQERENETAQALYRQAIALDA